MNLKEKEIVFWSDYIESSYHKNEVSLYIPKSLRAIIEGEQISGRNYQNVKIVLLEDKITIAFKNCKNLTSNGTECNSHIGVLLGCIKSNEINISCCQKLSIYDECILTFDL
ncbi:MAG: hypothetical protein NTY07_15440 [Bacteroidia bacterium]|nr:hypothetical protein [Bacteroidia bacterium]